MYDYSGSSGGTVHHKHSHESSNEPPADTLADPLLERGGDRFRPSIENRVAYQWETPRDSLGYRHATHRDQVVLGWLSEGLSTRPARVLDVGCAYGNLLLMLNARLGLDQRIRMDGIDLHEEGLEFGRAFASRVPGYANVHFSPGDLEKGLPFPSDSFDAVNFADVLEHLVEPRGALTEIRRVTRPGGIIVLSTPLKNSVFKRAAVRLNRVSRGRLYTSYYSGKGSFLGPDGEPVMETHAGHAHISEMTLPQLREVAEQAGLIVRDVQLMSVMSGSAWFDRHPFVLAGISALEAIHTVLRRPSWAHSVCLRLQVPTV